MKNRGAISVIVAITVTAILLIAAVIAVYIFYLLPAREVMPDFVPPSSLDDSISLPEESEYISGAVLHTIYYPIGKYGPDAERKEYESGEMTLRIPRLDLDTPVLNGVDEETLKNGIGLFDQAQLPGSENRNVSIAGHRDIYGKELYFIDTITNGDYIYLTYKGKEYKYEYEETFIVDPDDWEPISVKDYSRVTIQSCTPINVASHRIFVTGRLVGISDIGDVEAKNSQ